MAILRILDHAWHQTHSYRLHALPAEFWFLETGYRTWDESQRPRPANFQGFLDPLEVGDYAFDLILCHLDQWCDTRYPLRALPYRLVNLAALHHFPGVPRVAIMHGTPDDGGNHKRIMTLLDNTPGGAPFLVCNSQAAYDGWGLGPERSRAIIHGYDVDEFWSEKTRRLEIITVCSGGEMSREYHGIPLLERIRRDVPVTWIGARGDRDFFPDYRAYREYLATALIYLHTGKRSPMPGARTEAMLSGCCIVTTDNHDVGDFVDHGHSGFIADSAGELIDILCELLADPSRAYEVGQRGREAARAMFAQDRYVAEWLTLIAELTEGDNTYEPPDQ